jgi:hypothetical protein
MLRVEKILPLRSANWLAPWAIGVGLAVLAAAMVWRLPPIAGMTLVVLGATAATLERYRRTPLLRPMVIAHAATYGALYALFVAAVVGPSAGATLGFVEVADFVASLGLLAASAILIVGAWRSSSPAV